MELRTETKKRQDDARDIGESAGKHATEKVIKHLKEKHCETDDERTEFDKGVKKGKES